MTEDNLRELHYVALSTRAVLHDFIIDFKEKFPWYDLENLQGACGSGALLMASVLQHFDFAKQVCVQQFYYPGQNNGCHCWTRVNNEYFVDVTATQFGGPRVYVSKRKPYTDTMEQKYAMVVSSVSLPYVDIEALFSDMLDFFGWPSPELLTLDETHQLTELALQEYDYRTVVDKTGLSLVA